MNKTVNINLAGIFFHIDEDAYLKMHGYLNAIKNSLTESQGRAEIIADIEARIAELFNERVKHDRQVISLKEVDEVIAIMGQPEDYVVDDTIFEDDPQQSFSSKQQRNYAGSKKLFRDTDNSYIGGVASGMGHYFGIDGIWVRLLWVLLAFGSGGSFVFIYILFWILVPEAVTTTDKLNMTGEPVNISNIEKKIKDGFDDVSQNVSDAVKKMDLPKQGNKIKTSSKTFFDALGEIILFILKVVGKLIGLVLILIGAFSLIAMLIALFSVSVAEIVQIPGMDFLDATNAANIPIWLMSVMLFLTIAIPFFFLFYLGLKILVTNLKPIGQIAKFSILGLWLIAVIGLVVVGVKQASEYTEEAIVQFTEDLPILTSDTLYIGMGRNNPYSKQFGKHNNRWKPVYDRNDKKLLYLTDVRVTFKSTLDSIASIRVEKSSKGNTYPNAKERAQRIDYKYTLTENTLHLNGFLTTAFKNKYRDQEVEIILFIPEGTVFFADSDMYLYQENHMTQTSYSHHDGFDKIRDDNNVKTQVNGMKGHYLKIVNDEIICLDCTTWKDNDDSIQENSSELLDDENSSDSIDKRNSFEINTDHITSKTDNVEVKIDKNGIKISTEH